MIKGWKKKRLLRITDHDLAIQAINLVIRGNNISCDYPLDYISQITTWWLKLTGMSSEGSMNSVVIRAAPPNGDTQSSTFEFLLSLSFDIHGLKKVIRSQITKV